MPHSSIKIYFIPTCTPEFLRSEKRIRSQPECAGHTRSKPVFRRVNSPQQFSYFLRIRHRGPVFLPRGRLQNLNEISRQILLCILHLPCIPADFADDLSDPVRHVGTTLLLNLPDKIHKIGKSVRSQRNPTDRWKDMLFQTCDFLAPVRFRELRGADVPPFTGHCFECQTLLLFGNGGIKLPTFLPGIRINTV